ncbi:hypothetical protein BDV93DRAFT_520327 [Ceratobasidium sp. AG-I]|nr:hypothetical protein BDV93DRAFT_520327 [Ceratobasidium sp. AG-I]
MVDSIQTAQASTSLVPAPTPLPAPAPARPAVKDRLRRSRSPLRGEYGTLNVSGEKPYFILKDVWDDKPRTDNKSFDTKYLQVLDPRTKLQIYLYSNTVLLEYPRAIVEWKSPTEQTVDEEMKGVERSDEDPNVTQTDVDGSIDQPAYSNEMALLHADIAGWSADSIEDDEVLSIESSSDGEEAPVTVYYPLFPTPLIMNSKIRKKLEDLVAGKVRDDYYADCKELAARMLADLTGVENI